MLKELRIENLAIIDELDIELEEGLTVLTGETGAGKSIILDGISLVIGEKASKDMIGNNNDNVTVEAIFDINKQQSEKLEELDYDIEDELIISRIFDKDSNKVRINGKRFSLSSLKEISMNMLDIVGQHDHQYLLNSNYHLGLLDEFIKDSKEIKIDIKKVIENVHKVDKEISKIEKEKKEVLEKKELYEFVIKEIFSQDLQEDEEEELENEYNTLFNAGVIIENITNVEEILSKFEMRKLRREIEKLSSYSKEYEEIYTRVEEVLTQIDDIWLELSEKREEINQDPYALENVSKRLDIIKKLKLRYGSTIKEILDYGNEIKSKLSLINYSDEYLEKKEKEKTNLLEEYNKLSTELSKIRHEKAKFLKESIKKELLDLNMPNVEFEVEFKKQDKLDVNGYDVVKFLMSTNKGENLKDLSKIASGGEISRIMLALKIVFSKVDNITCLIFDEIDTGISGETVIKIAHKLKELSKKVQVICVTHSPQIAAKADKQFHIYKENDENRTTTKIRLLNEKERIREIARILSGDNITAASLEIAKEMMR